MSIKSTIPSFAADPSSVIYQRRKQRRWSVDELARRSQVSPNVIRYCERTASLPEEALYQRLDEALSQDAHESLPPLPPAGPVDPTLTKAFVQQTQRLQSMLASRKSA